MYSDGSHYALPLVTSDLGHMLWQSNPLLQTTVNPADLLFAQPSHGPSLSYGISHNVASIDYNFVGYPAVSDTPQGTSRCHPPVGFLQSMGHTSGQSSVIDDVSAGHLTELLTPVGRMSRGLSIICQWISEDWSICGQTITETTVPKHLADHGIRRMHKDLIIQCCWRECGMHIKRQGIVRHFREVHLGLKRKSHKYAFPRDNLCHCVL